MDGFFGRSSELASLDEAATGTFQDGHVAVVVVEGDPGAGKSRLLEEFLPRLPATSVVSVACYQPEGRLPLSLGRTLARALEITPGPGGWAELAEALHRSLSLRGPLAIVVDDAQWCDEESVGVLHYLLRGAISQDDPLLLVLAGRPSSTIAAMADALPRLAFPAFVHLELGPLDGADALALVRSLDRTLDVEEAGDLASRADGSPFWCRFLATSTDRDRSPDDIIGERLRTLSPDAVAVLTTGVVLARPVPLRDLRDIHGWPDERVDGAVGELVGTGFLVQQGWEVRLAHDLVRAAAEERLPESDRTHELIASWLENRAGDDVNELLAAAQHRRIAGLPIRPALERLLAAPMRRMVGLDGLEAIVDLVDEVPLDDASAVGLSRGLAALAGELGRHTLALERWSQVAGRLEDPADRARAWVAACEAAQHLERAEDARSHLREARRIAPAEPLLAIELDTTEARLSRWLEHDLDLAQQLTVRALDHARVLAQTTPDPAVRAAYLDALVLACVDAMQRNATDEILPLAQEISDAAAGADTRASVQARLRSGSALMLVGRLDAADRELSGAWTDASRAFLTDLVLDVGSWLTWTRYLRGRLAEAEEVAAECRGLADRLGERTRPASMLEQWRRIIAISRGNHLDALDALRQMAAGEADPHHRIGLRQAMATWLARLDPHGSADEVLGQLDAAASDAEAAGCDRCRADLLLTGADALARVGASEQADAWLEEGLGCANGGTLQGWLVTRAEASLATATGAARDLATAPLERAIAMADELGMGLEAIWARLDLGSVLAVTDPPRAAEVLRTAATSAQAAGAGTEARLAAQLLRRSGERTWHRASQPPADEPFGTLSPREREIAALVAAGASNPEIAQTLFLSRKTIERHVSNIFTKTGVKNRAQLAARMAAATTGR